MPDEVPESAETTQIAALRMADARSLHRADRAIFARRDARYRTERLAFLCGRQADGAAGRRGTRASRDRLLAVLDELFRLQRGIPRCEPEQERPTAAREPPARPSLAAVSAVMVIAVCQETAADVEPGGAIEHGSRLRRFSLRR